jgi:hypothetical protein
MRLDQELVSEINRFADAPTAPVDYAGMELEEMDAICIKRRVQKRKGSVWQLPHDL